VSSSSGLLTLLRSRLRSQAHMTPSRPPEYLIICQQERSLEFSLDSQQIVGGIYSQTIDTQSMTTGRIGERKH